MTAGDLILFYIGSEGCHNCSSFEPEWKKLETLGREGKLDYLSVELKKIKVQNHGELPPALRETVTFYPFLFLVPRQYYLKNENNEEILVGEAFYSYKVMTNGVMEYRFGNDVRDSPSMRYHRTAEGIRSWLEDIGINAINHLAPRYYPELIEPMSKRIRLRRLNPIDWRAEQERFHKDMLLIPSLNKVYKLSSGGVVLHQRIRNNHD